MSALEMADPMYDVILWNVLGARCPGISVMEPKGGNHGCKPKELVMAMETRAGKMRRSKSLQAIAMETSVSELKDLQNKEETLAECRKLAATSGIRRSGRGCLYCLILIDNVLLSFLHPSLLNYCSLVGVKSK